MAKKEYLLKVLTQLEPIRNLAKWLKVLVEQWKFDENILDILIEAVQWAVDTAKSDLAKEKLQKWLDVMKKMEEIEEKSKIQDKKDLEELDQMLENI